MLGDDGLPAAHRPAVPFLQRRLWQLRRFPRHAGVAQAQGAEEGAARGAGRRHHHRLADRQRPHRGAWDAFFAFYMDTGGRKWGRPYLNRKFFSLIGERMADDVLLVMAKRDGRYIAGAINFIGSDALYGRNWGCIEDHPFLHFEVCYHQAIDFAIAGQAEGGRGRRAGRAQAGARLHAGHDAFRPLHRPSRAAPRRRRLPEARAPRSGAHAASISRSTGRSARASGRNRMTADAPAPACGRAGNAIAGGPT